MDVSGRIERALEEALGSLSSPASPPGLLAAIRQAVHPGGARLRPRLCLAVASACGDPAPAVADAAAAAVELIHCASLVHDDLPCFDDAPTRRGSPSVHCAHGEAIAVLAGDQLIVLAFETLARGVIGSSLAGLDARRAGQLFEALARGVGLPYGIIAGQAWESEPRIPLVAYRRAKTGALFEAAAVAGAVAAAEDGSAWRVFGQRIGEAYQVADDLLDVIGDPTQLGKPVGRDGVLGRPNVARQLGVSEASRQLGELVRQAIDAAPRCRSGDELRRWVNDLGDRLSRLLQSQGAAHAAVGFA